MTISLGAGKPAEAAMLVNVPALITAYYTEVPDPAVPEQRVAFDTSGHRGSAFDKAFEEAQTIVNDALAPALLPERPSSADSKRSQGRVA